MHVKIVSIKDNVIQAPICWLWAMNAITRSFPSKAWDVFHEYHQRNSHAISYNWSRRRCGSASDAKMVLLNLLSYNIQGLVQSVARRCRRLRLGRSVPMVMPANCKPCLIHYCHEVETAKPSNQAQMITVLPSHRTIACIPLEKQTQ